MCEFSGGNSCLASTIQLQPPRSPTNPNLGVGAEAIQDGLLFEPAEGRMDQWMIYPKKSGCACCFSMYIGFSSQVELLRIGRTVRILQRPRRPRSHFQSKPSSLIALVASDAWIIIVMVVAAVFVDVIGFSQNSPFRDPKKVLSCHDDQRYNLSSVTKG